MPVQTGITGTTDIEVLERMKEGDEIVTGSYKVLRTLRPGSSVKIDNTAPKKEDESHNVSRRLVRPTRKVGRGLAIRRRPKTESVTERTGAKTIGEVSGTGPGEKHGNRRSNQYCPTRSVWLHPNRA